MSDAPERPRVVSLSGDAIQRHGDRAKPFEVSAAGDDTEVLEAHITEHLGPVDFVYHEILSDLVHVDVHHVPPTSQCPYHFLVTTGMSDRPMQAPEGAEDCSYAELLVVLPGAWPVTQEAFADEQHYWPVRSLKFLARLPHAYDTWLWWGHSVPNGDPPEPFHSSVAFSCLLLGPSLLAPAAFAKCEVRPDKVVHFFALHPLFPEETALKLRGGAEAVFDAFGKHGITELISPDRRNVGLHWWQRFGRRT